MLSWGGRTIVSSPQTLSYAHVLRMCSKKGRGKGKGLGESAYTATDPGILIAFICGQTLTR